MAIKALMLKKKIDRANSNLAPIMEKFEELETRESELQKALEEAETDEEISAVEEEVEKLESEKEENNKKIAPVDILPVGRAAGADRPGGGRVCLHPVRQGGRGVHAHGRGDPGSQGPGADGRAGADPL